MRTVEEVFVADVQAYINAIVSERKTAEKSLRMAVEHLGKLLTAKGDMSPNEDAILKRWGYKGEYNLIKKEEEPDALQS